MTLDVVTGWPLFAGLVVVTGAVTARWFLIGGDTALSDPVRRDIHRSDAARLGGLGSALLIAGLAMFFARQLIEFRDPWSPWLADARLLMGTAWGRTWGVAAAASILLAAAFAAARRRPAFWWLAQPLVVGLSAFPALTGHAAGSVDRRSLLIAVDILHVASAGVWIGGLAAVLWVDRSFRRSTGDTTALAPLVAAFSPVAFAAVLVLMATGAVSSYVHLPPIDRVPFDPWSRLLAAKVVAVAAVLALGFHNLRTHTAASWPGRGQGESNLRRSSLVELLVAQFVLIITALLVRTGPMSG